MPENFKKILAAGIERYPSTLKHLLVLLSMMNFCISYFCPCTARWCDHIVQEPAYSCHWHGNWCLVTQQDFGVTSPKGFSKGSKSLFRYSDSPCSVWRRSSNSEKKDAEGKGCRVGIWDCGSQGVPQCSQLLSLAALPPCPLIVGPESGGGCTLPGGEPSPPASLRGIWGLKVAASGVLYLHTILLSTGRAGPSSELLF